jgi:hypothetical protein
MLKSSVDAQRSAESSHARELAADLEIRLTPDALVGHCRMRGTVQQKLPEMFLKCGDWLLDLHGIVLPVKATMLKSAVFEFNLTCQGGTEIC